MSSVSRTPLAFSKVVNTALRNGKHIKVSLSLEMCSLNKCILVMPKFVKKFFEVKIFLILYFLGQHFCYFFDKKIIASIILIHTACFAYSFV